MDLTTMVGLGSLLTAALGLIGFLQAQGTKTREAIEAGDKAVREAEGKARHDLTNRMQVVDSELRRDVEQLRRESYRREEAREMEGRLSSTMNRIEGKVDRHSDQMAELMSLKASLNLCVEQVRDLAGRLTGARP